MIKLVNQRQLSQALRQYARVSKKTEVEIVNKTLKDVAFRAAQFTAPADPQKIDADLRRNDLGLKLAAKELKAAGEPITKTSLARRAREIARRRKGKRFYQRAGWLSALLLMGFPIRGRGVKSPPSVLGGVKKATMTRPVGEILNRVFGEMSGPAAGRSMAKMVTALNAAVRFVTRDRLQYAERKLKQALRKYS